ncbi:YqgQ family protein [Jeotgalibacillus sp. R-1-5s-1]|uniref:YqgQ family protein n=1 Tax=Jeotgalibacillus sp. R-1-5s-1 TaxID=2555897 RepID=UPI00352AA65D
MELKTMFDVQQLLKRFGLFIYGHNRTSTLELMEVEIRELYESGMIDRDIFRKAVLVLRSEMNKEMNG